MRDHRVETQLWHMRDDCIIDVSEKNAIPQLPDELFRIIMRFKYKNFIASLPPRWVFIADPSTMSFALAQNSRTAVSQHKSYCFIMMFFACLATVLLLYGGGVIG